MKPGRTSGEPLEELRFALAEADTHQPPGALRSRVLAAAVSARSPGRTAGPSPVISPVDAYHRTIESLNTVLSELSVAEWHQPVLRDLDVQGLIGHLIGVERQLQRALALPPVTATNTDHVASTQADALAQAGRPPSATRAEWRGLASATIAATASLDQAALDRPITLHTFTVPIGRMLVVRSFETWTHEEDIRRATGRPLAAPDASRLHLMTELAVSALPTGLNLIARPKPGRTARIVLTGPGGGTWQASLDRSQPGTSDVRIILDATSFCRIVANRVGPEHVDIDITGDQALAEDLLAGAQALALD